MRGLSLVLFVALWCSISTGIEGKSILRSDVRHYIQPSYGRKHIDEETHKEASLPLPALPPRRAYTLHSAEEFKGKNIGRVSKDAESSYPDGGPQTLTYYTERLASYNPVRGPTSGGSFKFQDREPSLIDEGTSFSSSSSSSSFGGFRDVVAFKDGTLHSSSSGQEVGTGAGTSQSSSSSISKLGVGRGESSFHFSDVGSEDDKTKRFQYSTSSSSQSSSGSDIVVNGGRKELVFGSSSSKLPTGFNPFEIFIPPPSPSTEVRSESTGQKIEIDSEKAAQIHLERADCIPSTVTVQVTETKVYPLSKISARTQYITTSLPATQTHFVKVTEAKEFINTVSLTTVSTVISTFSQVTTSTTYAPVATLTSTRTTTVTNYVDRTARTTLTDTVFIKTTDYVTDTRRVVVTTSTFLPVYTTSFVHLPVQVRSVSLTHTRTVTVDRTLPPKINYVSQTVRLTETLTQTQQLYPETIAQTSTTIVPSYSTIFSTFYKVRTQTLRTTIPIVKTKTLTEYSSTYRVAIASNTVYSTVTQTQSGYDYYTTLEQRYVTVSATQRIPITQTRVSTFYSGIREVTTLPGPTVTSYSTQTSYVSVVKTVTEHLSTPVAYATTTVTENCTPY